MIRRKPIVSQELLDKSPYKAIALFFWHYIRPYKGWYLTMLLAPVITGFFPFAYNYAIKLFLDIMASPGPLTYYSFLWPIGLFLSAQILLDATWRLTTFAEWRSEPYVRSNILTESYDYVQYHSYPFFQENFSGTLISKIRGLVDGYDKFWGEIHHGFSQNILKLMISLPSIFLFNFKLGLFIFTWALSYVVIIYFLAQKLNCLSFIETESWHKAIGQVADKITNIMSIFSFASRQRELKSLRNGLSSDFIPKQIMTYKYGFKMDLVGCLLYCVMLLFLVFYMLHLKLSGQISIGDFAFVFGIMFVIANDLWETQYKLQDFSRDMGNLKSSLFIIATPQENLDKPNAKPLIVKSPNIEFRDIKFSYDGKHSVFNGLNLTIQPGEKIGLVGHSGAGKSSLINLLLRYFSYDQGEILISGQNIENVTQDSLREAISVIPQDVLLFHRTLIDNIRYGKPEASDEEVIEASKKAYLHDFILTLPEQYQTQVGERGIKLSGGQRQRVAIARAILKDSPIFILDEATSSLDSQAEQLIQESLRFLIRDKKKTVIAIAHRLSTLKHMDRIIVLDKGEICEEGTHDMLIHNKDGVYQKLWELQKI